MDCFGFQEEPSCQYDPHHIISNRRKKQKRSKYDHKGTEEMEQRANKLVLSGEEERSDEIEDMDNIALTIVDPKGKRPMGQQIIGASDRKAKRPKLVKDPFLQIVEYPTPTMELAKGKIVDTEKTIVEQYNFLNDQARKEREITKDELRSTQSP